MVGTEKQVAWAERIIENFEVESKEVLKNEVKQLETSLKNGNNVSDILEATKKAVEKTEIWLNKQIETLKSGRYTAGTIIEKRNRLTCRATSEHFNKIMKRDFWEIGK
nr:MAG TPA: hypothetical protein [Bacteriophage sp.]